MDTRFSNEFHERLLLKKQELSERLDRINLNVRRPLSADSKERATQLESSEVVDALGNEAREELAKVSAALAKISTGQFGICPTCAGAIDRERLEAYPYALECIDCAAITDRTA